MTGQLQLIPKAPLTFRERTLDLSQLVGYENARPRPGLVEWVGRAGRLLQRAAVTPTGEGTFEVVDGRRRTKAIELNVQSGKIPAPGKVHVLCVGGPDTTRREVLAALTLMMHATRSASIASELTAIEEILASAGGHADQTTVSAIAEQTDMSVQTVRKRLRLRQLIPDLRTVLDNGTINGSVAEAAARLPEALQVQLGERLANGERLTAKIVRELSREQTRTAAQALPSDLFGTRETGWQLEVAGHLKAARGAIPDDPAQQGLAAAIEAALALA
jgi:ParB-like chromosome segregation protein Spo0J